MKSYVKVAIIFTAIGVLVGLSIGYFSHLFHNSKGVVGISISEVGTFFINSEGFVVEGKLTDLQITEIQAISAEVKIFDKENTLMSIQFINPTEVEVMTGVHHGPLNGHGNYLTLRKVNGRWQLQKGPARIWME